MYMCREHYLFTLSALFENDKINSQKQGWYVAKILRGKRFYKGHRDIVDKASYHFKNASISLKMYLKSLKILDKASISLKNYSKIIEIFIKAPHFKTNASMSLEILSKSRVILVKFSY
jgi:hypothetical protein